MSGLSSHGQSGSGGDLRASSPAATDDSWHLVSSSDDSSDRFPSRPDTPALHPLLTDEHYSDGPATPESERLADSVLGQPLPRNASATSFTASRLASSAKEAVDGILAAAAAAPSPASTRSRSCTPLVSSSSSSPCGGEEAQGVHLLQQLSQEGSLEGFADTSRPCSPAAPAAASPPSLVSPSGPPGRGGLAPAPPPPPAPGEAMGAQEGEGGLVLSSVWGSASAGFGVGLLMTGESSSGEEAGEGGMGVEQQRVVQLEGDQGVWQGGEAGEEEGRLGEAGEQGQPGQLQVELGSLGCVEVVMTSLASLPSWLAGLWRSCLADLREELSDLHALLTATTTCLASQAAAVHSATAGKLIRTLAAALPAPTTSTTSTTSTTNPADSEELADACVSGTKQEGGGRALGSPGCWGGQGEVTGGLPLGSSRLPYPNLLLCGLGATTVVAVVGAVGLWLRCSSLASSLQQRDKELARLLVRIMHLQEALQFPRTSAPLLRHTAIHNSWAGGHLVTTNLM